MSIQTPFKLLEINVISAQDLPPVSKLLRTYVVAWVHPDHKQTTRIDHHGHTNPTWNHKLVFRVDERFLRSAAAVVIEIYNVAWLRDIPIGTTQVLINNLFPSLNWCQKNSTMRSVPLQIRRPSGHLQGILNVGINLLEVFDNNKSQEQIPQQKGANIQTKRSRDDGFPLRHDGKILNGSELGVQQTKAVVSDGSPCSVMRPLPSEVAAEMKKGLYSTEENEIGSSIFENWTVAGDSEKGMRSKSVRWRREDEFGPTEDREDSRHGRRRRRNSDGGGLFSCFGNAYGFECTFMCGSNSTKKSRKKQLVERDDHFPRSEENLRRLYI
ncbi:unnamed protein product [Ilex paraguariensis]|uniref:C2 domain-containing protein n=1 Tax=Ilex paraguariensis TaxID=185542 RepID=A0ABC8SMJ6_9AQUA